MATASITKQFVIKDDSVCQRLIDEMNNPNRKKEKDRQILTLTREVKSY